MGLALGVDRELRRKPAGLRTHALVAIGAALVTLSSVRIAGIEGEMDAEAISRAMQGIIAGVGFLGGGVILKAHEEDTVRNLTTAASLWVAAGLGIVCGAGQWALAIVALALTLGVLALGGPAERKLHERYPTVGPPPGERRGDAPPR